MTAFKHGVHWKEQSLMYFVASATDAAIGFVACALLIGVGR